MALGAAAAAGNVVEDDAVADLEAAAAVAQLRHLAAGLVAADHVAGLVGAEVEEG